MSPIPLSTQWGGVIRHVAAAMCLIGVGLACQQKPTLDVNLTAKDLTPPQVLSITPANGATEVIDKPTIVIVFNESMDAGTLNSATVTVKTANGTPGVGSYEYDDSTKALAIKIVEQLYLNTQYTITITDKVKDRAGNAISPLTSTFSTDVCPKARAGKPVFNGSVRAVGQIGCTLYLGGQFTGVGNGISNGILLDGTTADVAGGFSYLEINGHVWSVASDGSGGYYIGGDFTSVGGVTRNRLARIGANGELLPWNPGAGNRVYAIAVAGGVVYVGGEFITIAGVPRSFLAAISTDGSLLSWNPGSNGAISALAISGSTVYVGGSFTSISGNTRNRLAAIGTDGVLQSWDPDANGKVSALAIYGSTVYVGGSFTSISGNTRNRLAAVGTNGVLHTWNPNPIGTVSALAIFDDTIYAGGSFNCLGNCPAGIEGTDKWTRNGLAALSLTGAVQPWNLNATSGSVFYALLASGGTLYAAGSFASIRPVTRNNLAAVTTDGQLLDWNPNPNAHINSIAVTANTVYVGGAFTCMGPACTPGARNRLAAISPDGTLLPWNPNANNTVNALVHNGSTIYAGGEFTSILGNPRNRLAGIATDGTLAPWNPSASDGVSSLAVSGSTVYAGGNFTCLGNCPAGSEGTDKWTRNRLAAIGTDGAVQPWNPGANNSVASIVVSGSTVYAGGSFTCLGNCPAGSEGTDKWTRNRLAAIGTDGAVQPWNPNANESVADLVVLGDTVYAGGIFTSIQGIARNRLAAIAADGTPLAWDPNANNPVSSLFTAGGTLYIGGSFQSLGNSLAGGFASINSDGSLNW